MADYSDIWDFYDAQNDTGFDPATFDPAIDPAFVFNPRADSDQATRDLGLTPADVSSYSSTPMWESVIKALGLTPTTAGLLAGGVGLSALMGGNKQADTGYQGGIPYLTANRTMLPVPPSTATQANTSLPPVAGAPLRRPGSGGVTYFTPMTYTRGTSNPGITPPPPAPPVTPTATPTGTSTETPTSSSPETGTTGGTPVTVIGGTPAIGSGGTSTTPTPTATTPPASWTGAIPTQAEIDALTRTSAALYNAYASSPDYGNVNSPTYQAYQTARNQQYGALDAFQQNAFLQNAAGGGFNSWDAYTGQTPGATLASATGGGGLASLTPTTTLTPTAIAPAPTVIAPAPTAVTPPYTTVYSPSETGGFARGGIATLAKGRLLDGPGDGVSDSIPASIDGHQPAALADGEYVIPARIVSELGNGSTKAGAAKLDAMMKRVQTARRKATDIAANTRVDKYLPQ